MPEPVARPLLANLQNLDAFWRACGVESLRLPSGREARRHRSWPGRLWLPPADAEPLDASDRRALVDAAGSAILPVWSAADGALAGALTSAGFEQVLTQEAMVLESLAGESSSDGLARLELRPLRGGPAAATEWARVAAEAFGYPVDANVVAECARHDHVHPRLAWVDGEPVASALLMQTGSVAGLHMLGVPPTHRRRGYARLVMHGLLAFARELGCSQATLQASAAGEGLYRQLGFVAQGPIRSFRAPIAR